MNISFCFHNFLIFPTKTDLAILIFAKNHTVRKQKQDTKLHVDLTLNLFAFKQPAQWPLSKKVKEITNVLKWRPNFSDHGTKMFSFHVTLNYTFTLLVKCTLLVSLKEEKARYWGRIITQDGRGFLDSMILRKHCVN